MQNWKLVRTQRNRLATTKKQLAFGQGQKLIKVFGSLIEKTTINLTIDASWALDPAIAKKTSTHPNYDYECRCLICSSAWRHDYYLQCIRWKIVSGTHRSAMHESPIFGLLHDINQKVVVQWQRYAGFQVRHVCSAITKTLETIQLFLLGQTRWLIGALWCNLSEWNSRKTWLDFNTLVNQRHCYCTNSAENSQVTGFLLMNFVGGSLAANNRTSWWKRFGSFLFIHVLVDVSVMCGMVGCVRVRLQCVCFGWNSYKTPSGRMKSS